MKKHIYKFFSTLFLSFLLISIANAQSFEIRTVENDYGYL